MSVKRGQVAVFVIVAIVVVAGILLLVAFRDDLLGVSGISPEFAPVYVLYDECIKEETENAVSLLGTQGGRLGVGDFEPGSDFAPFSSHLNFLGIPVPYWYYISGNNLVKEQAPSKNDMERELSDYLVDRINECDFSEFYEQGFYVELNDDVGVSTNILDNRVEVDVTSDIVVSKEDRSARKTSHNIEVNSRIGALYDVAREIYDMEISDAFLEEYAIDVLRLNAPVDGVEVQCSPEIWETREVVDNLKRGLEINMAAIKFTGNYYSLDEQGDDYFVVDIPGGIGDNVAVNLMYSQDWPTKVEIVGGDTDNELMIAEPVGNDQGLGLLGFCYVPYHFVYDVSFPVLIQISDNFEIFQFPVAVIIDNNVAREVNLLSLDLEESEVDVCQFRDGEVTVNTFDSFLNPIEAEIEYRCFDNVCDLGRTEISGSDAVLNSDIPLCVNGNLVARADGFAEKSMLFSSNSENFADIILDKEYEISVDLLVGARELEGTAVVYFNGEDRTESVVLPSNNLVTLQEGSYEIQAYVYGDSRVVIPASTKIQCQDVARSGIAGFFGATKEECFNIEVPEVVIDNALVGGGTQNEFIFESDLQSGRILVEVDSLVRPNSLEQLQYNFQAFNDLGLEVEFR